jgi:hypothetical protein
MRPEITILPHRREQDCRRNQRDRHAETRLNSKFECAKLEAGELPGGGTSGERAGVVIVSPIHETVLLCIAAVVQSAPGHIELENPRAAVCSAEQFMIHES